jgi:predicted phage tail protein
VLSESLEALPPLHSMWAIDSPALAVQQFRVMSVAEDFSDTEIKFTINAVRHNSSKYGAIDNGSRIERPPISVVPPSVQKPPTNVTLSNDHFVDQGSAISVMTITWERPEAAIAYEVYWRKDEGDWIFAGRTGTTSIDVSGIYAGRYTAKVRAINSLDIGSVFATSAETLLNGKTTPPPEVSSFTAESIVFGIKLKWEIPQGVSTADLQRTEIWYSETNQISDATKFGDYTYPQTDLTIMGLAPGKTYFFWARLVDRIGNIGAFFGPVFGQSSVDAGPILDYLNDKITETQLSQHLLEKIDSGGGAQVEVEALKTELAAMYSIKTQLTVDGKPYLAGIGIGVENDEGMITSQVLIAASRFAVVDPNTANVFYPFVVQGGAAYIDTAFIRDGSITMLKIGQALQSDNYVAGVQGWRLDKAGNLEFNGPAPGGGRLTVTNRAVKVYDENGVKRVQLGDLSA